MSETIESERPGFPMKGVPQPGVARQTNPSAGFLPSGEGDWCATGL
jgi:hypothetical protein